MNALPPRRKLMLSEYLWLMLLALFAVSVFNLGGYILVLMLGLYLVLHIHSIRISLLALSLMLFSFFYFCFYSVYETPGVTEVFNYLVAPWTAFLFGEMFTKHSPSRKAHFYIIGVLALGLFAHGALNLVAYLRASGAGLSGRVAYDFWRGEWISVTANGLYYPMALGLALGALFSSFGKSVKVLALGVIAVATVNATLLGHRTSLYIIVLLLLYNVVGTVLRSDLPETKKTRFLISGMLVLILAAVAYGLNVAGIRTWVESSSLYRRMTDASAVNSTDRQVIWVSFFRQAFQYPLGGEAFQLAGGQSYVHNLWLDVYYRVGIFPFVCLVAATVMILRQFFALRGLCRRTGNDRFKTVMTNLYLAFFLSAAVEPVIEANPYVLIAFLMITGCVSGILQMERRDGA